MAEDPRKLNDEACHRLILELRSQSPGLRWDIDQEVDFLKSRDAIRIDLREEERRQARVIRRKARRFARKFDPRQMPLNFRETHEDGTILEYQRLHGDATAAEAAWHSNSAIRSLRRSMTDLELTHTAWEKKFKNRYTDLLKYRAEDYFPNPPVAVGD